MLFLFSEIGEEQIRVAGSKAANLCRMSREGLPVPPGAVLAPEAFDAFLEAHKASLGPQLAEFQQAGSSEKQMLVVGKAIFDEIRSLSVPETILGPADTYREQLAAEGFEGIAVRSSGNMEDTADASFAGQYETVLNVKSRAQLEKALLECWASAFNERVLTYCLRKELDPNKIRLSVILQAMVPAETAGVLFSVDPMKGRDTVMVIEAVQGLGEALVQGTVTPDTFHYDWYQEKLIHANYGEQDRGLFPKPDGEIEWKLVTGRSLAKNDPSFLNLVDLSLKAQVQYGYPVDLEWAIFQGKVFLLQARPITSIRFEVDQDWTNADFKDGGISSTIATPYMWSLYREVFSTTMPHFLKQVHIYPDYEPSSWATWFLGYPYWNLAAVKNGAKKIPGFIERKFDEDLGIEPDYSDEGHVTRFTPASLFRGIKILLATERSIKKREAVSKGIIDDYSQLFNNYKNGDWVVAKDKEFLTLLTKAWKEHYIRLECTYFYTIYDNSNATTFYHEALEKYNKKAKEKVQPLKLIGGLEQLSHMRPVYALWELRSRILQNTEAAQFYQQEPTASIVSKYQANQSFPFSDELKAYLEQFPHHSLRELDILVPHWEEDPTQVIESLKSLLSQSEDHTPALQNSRQHKLYQAERAKIKSKSLLKKLETHRKMLWWREEMRDQSTRMYYWLRKLGLEAGRRLVKKGVLEQVEDFFFLEYEEALSLFAGKDQEKWVKQIQKNRIYYQSFRNWEKPNEIWAGERREVVAESEGAHLLRGIGCSSGNKEAVISVVEDIFHVDELVEGTILVTKFTDPAWTPVFARISGLITETGGMLSHGAVVSREYGIPAVLAVKGATTRLKSGMKVEINGDQGVIKIIKEEGNEG